MRRAWAWCRRRHRVVLPFAVLALLAAATTVAHLTQRVDVTDPDYLNPASTAAIGGADLAGRVRAAGVTVRAVTGADEAIRLAGDGDVTLFVPAPGLLSAGHLVDLRQLPASTVVVLVAPDAAAVAAAAPMLRVTGQRWATRTAAPGCPLPAAAGAGPAAVDGVDYTGTGVLRCYDGGLVELDGGPRVLVAGASDPFRNDRIGEDGNAALSTALLTGTGTVVWLDLHRAEPAPPDVTATPPDVDPRTGPSTPPTGLPRTNPITGPDTGDGGDGSKGSDDRSGLAALFPGWLWTTIGLLALVGLVLALAASRRLGPPVAEPMPVTARARESLEGRGRLYKQARQPAVALGVLRASALGHLPGRLGLPLTTPTAALVAAVAGHTGYPPEVVDAILVTDTPDNHAELVAAVDRLDELMWALHRGHPTAQGDSR